MCFFQNIKLVVRSTEHCLLIPDVYSHLPRREQQRKQPPPFNITVVALPSSILTSTCSTATRDLHLHAHAGNRLSMTTTERCSWNLGFYRRGATSTRAEKPCLICLASLELLVVSCICQVRRVAAVVRVALGAHIPLLFWAIAFHASDSLVADGIGTHPVFISRTAPLKCQNNILVLGFWVA